MIDRYADHQQNFKHELAWTWLPHASTLLCKHSRNQAVSLHYALAYSTVLTPLRICDNSRSRLISNGVWFVFGAGRPVSGAGRSSSWPAILCRQRLLTVTNNEWVLLNNTESRGRDKGTGTGKCWAFHGTEVSSAVP